MRIVVNDLEKTNAAPLGLPEGSIRSILAILMVIGAFILLYQHKISFDRCMLMQAPVVALYFGQYIKSPQG